MKEEKGMTLIALVLTIIVMLILVAVTVFIALDDGETKPILNNVDVTDAVKENGGELEKKENTNNSNQTEIVEKTNNGITVVENTTTNQ